eukprot:3715027-Rhodomonas_salina.1
MASRAAATRPTPKENSDPASNPAGLASSVYSRPHSPVRAQHCSGSLSSSHRASVPDRRLSLRLHPPNHPPFLLSLLSRP